jgi:hypothetical protein
LRARSCAIAALGLLLAGCVANDAHVDASAPPHVREALKYEGKGNVTGFRGPWCRAFVNKVLRDTGHPLADTSLAARDAVNLGQHISTPQPGAVFVMPHHTGLVWRVLGPHQFESVEGNAGHRVRIVMRDTAGLQFVMPN